MAPGAQTERRGMSRPVRALLGGGASPAAYLGFVGSVRWAACRELRQSRWPAQGAVTRRLDAGITWARAAAGVPPEAPGLGGPAAPPPRCAAAPTPAISTSPNRLPPAPVPYPWLPCRTTSAPPPRGPGVGGPWL